MRDSITEKIVKVLPGTAVEVAKKTRLPLPQVKKCLVNLRTRGKVVGKGRGTVFTRVPPSLRARKLAIRSSKRGLIKKKRPAALLVYLDVLEVRISNLEQIIGVNK